MLCKCSSYWRNYTSRMSPTLKRGSEIQHFECSSTIEIHNGIIFLHGTALCEITGFIYFVVSYTPLLSVIEVDIIIFQAI